MRTGDVDINGTHFRLKNVTTTARDAITSPLRGMEIYNTTTEQVEQYNGTAWVAGAGTVGPQGPQGVPGNTGATGAQGPQGSNAPNICYTQTFQRASLSGNSIVVSHDLNASVIVSVYDTTGTQIIPTNVQAISTNAVRLDFTDWDTVNDFNADDIFKCVVIAAGGSGGTGTTSEDAVVTFPLAMGSNYWTPNPAGSLHLTAVAIPYSCHVDQMEVYIANPFTTTGTKISVGIYTNSSYGSTPVYNQYALSASVTTLTSQPAGLFRIPLTTTVTLSKNRVYWFMVFIQGSSYGSLLQTSSMTTNVPNALGFQLDNITSPANPVTSGSANSTRIWLQASNSAGN